MEFRNLTPFPALCFSALDPADQEHRVIVMKVTYRLLPGKQGYGMAELVEENPAPLCMADEYLGEPGQSETYCESDLAPYKPRCDVILRGNAYAPQSQAAPQWVVRLQLRSPEDNDGNRAVLVDKTLNIAGESTFYKRPLIGWKRTDPTPATQVRLGWDKAFGGCCLIPNTDDKQQPPLLNEVCFSNPLGVGWMDERWSTIAKKAGLPMPERIPAPQIESPDHALVAPFIIRNPDGDLDAKVMAAVAEGYGHKPAGFGVVGRSWAPRLALAGTYDAAWKRKDPPGLPADFDFAYWNCAPVDQQTDYPLPGFSIRLLNLTPPSHAVDGLYGIELPKHRAFVLLRMHNGVLLPLPLLTDTVLIDTDSMTVSLVHRVSFPKGDSVRVVEARFQPDPDAALLLVEQPKRES